MKPYIGQGDKGTTSLLGGGKKVPKDCAQVEAYGALDELVSLIGYIRACNNSLTLHKGVRDKQKQTDELLEKIQDHLFRIESHVSTRRKWENHPALPYLGEEHIKFLEEQIQKYEEGVPELKNFILPGGSTVAALLHVARAQTRLVERRLLSLAREKTLHPFAIPYLNRLSDVFFALARWINYKEGKKETLWVGRGKKDCK